MMNVDLSETAIRNTARFNSLGTQLVEETRKETTYTHVASMLDRGCDADQISYLLNEPIELVIEVQKSLQNEKN